MRRRPMLGGRLRDQTRILHAQDLSRPIIVHLQSTQVDTMKLRLFALRDTSTNKLLAEQFFHDKPAAKKERDRLNAAGGSYVVTAGPDHRRYKA